MERKFIFKNIRYLNPVSMCLDVGDIRIQGNQISEIGKNLNVHEDEVVFIKDNYIVLPGLINSHLHPSKEVYGSLLDASPIEHVLDTVHKNNELEDSVGQFVSSLKSIGCGLQKGITSFGIFTSRIESDYHAVSEAKARCVINYCQSNHWAGSGKSPENKSVDTIVKEYLLAEERYQNNLVTFTPATASELSADDELLVTLHEIAVKNGSKFTLHIHEGEHQVNAHVQAYTVSGIERLYALGILDKNTTLIHACHINEKERSIIKKSGCRIIHCPVSNSFVGAGTLPVKELLATNTVGIGTDAAMVNPINDLTFDALFALYHHGDSNFQSKIEADQVLHMMTDGGASALGLESTGIIKEGFKADLIIYEHLEGESEYINTSMSILTMINKEKPAHVFIDGEIIVNDYSFTNKKLVDNVKEYSLLRSRVKL